MKSEQRSFDSIWIRVIKPAIITCEKEISEDFRNEANVRTRDLAEYKTQIAKMYREKRAWLKREYLPDEDSPSLDLHKLAGILCRCVIGYKFFGYDIAIANKIHKEKKRAEKTAATSDEQQSRHMELVQWEKDNPYVNYKLAFLIAEGLAFDDLLYWAQCGIVRDKEAVKKDKSLKEQEIKQLNTRITLLRKLIDKLCCEKRLRCYTSSRHHDGFIMSMIVALMKADYLQRDFDYLMFSALIFQWQEYTKEQILMELIQECAVGQDSAQLTAQLSYCKE